MSEGGKPKKTFCRYRGGSMWPGFQEGDLLEIKQCDLSSLQVGDCIVYQHTKATTTAVHRIYRKQRDSCLTRGDARPEPDDDAVKPEWIQGKVIARFRFGRRSKVTGGWAGVLTGLFYRYAGRFNPERQSRGGRLACTLRKFLRCISFSLEQKGTVRRFPASDRSEAIYWGIGKHVIATFEDTCCRWVISWPYSLLFEPKRLPVIKNCSQSKNEKTTI